jgi:hypothetical protein
MRNATGCHTYISMAFFTRVVCLLSCICVLVIRSDSPYCNISVPVVSKQETKFQFPALDEIIRENIGEMP